MDIEAFRNKKPEWLLKLNPNGKIPVLLEEGSWPEVTHDSCLTIAFTGFLTVFALNEIPADDGFPVFIRYAVNNARAWWQRIAPSNKLFH